MPELEQLRDLEASLVWGAWPRRGVRAEDQHGKRLVSPEVVRDLAPDEQSLILLPPPFQILSDDVSGNTAFWNEFGALDELDPDEAVIVADFGIGSDSVVVVDFRAADAPKVLRLRWGEQGNHWVAVASNIAQFRSALRIE